MKPEHRNTVRRNPGHFTKARITAAMSVLADRKLLGIPSVRPEVIRAAALAALSIPGTFDEGVLQAAEPENREVIAAAIETATTAARDALSALPALRPARPRRPRQPASVALAA